MCGVSIRGRDYWERWSRRNLTADSIDLYPRREYAFHALLMDARSDKIGISEILAGVGDLAFAIDAALDQARSVDSCLD